MSHFFVIPILVLRSLLLTRGAFRSSRLAIARLSASQARAHAVDGKDWERSFRRSRPSENQFRQCQAHETTTSSRPFLLGQRSFFATEIVWVLARKRTTERGHASVSAELHETRERLCFAMLASVSLDRVACIVGASRFGSTLGTCMDQRSVMLVSLLAIALARFLFVARTRLQYTRLTVKYMSRLLLDTI